MKALLFLLISIPTALAAADLTGNWVVREPLPDGTERRTYLDLHQDGGKITGHIRMGVAYLTVTEGSGGPEQFTLVTESKEGANTRRREWPVKLSSDGLHVTVRRRQNSPPVEMVAQRAPAGEGALPVRQPLPALHKVSSNGLARTPPMGWNSWNKFAERVDDAGVRAAADAMVANGMKDAGYIYVNIDDTWQGERDKNGKLNPNKKFPDMKALATYVHSRGLKIGIYSSPGPNTCAGYEGSFGHEAQDAQTYAEWGIDYLKYDWCGARNLYSDSEMQPLYQKMGDALQKTGRPILYSLCQYGRADVWKWGPDVGGNSWRTTGDIRDAWDSMAKIGFSQNELAPYAAPGHWNDPDMLEVGNGGMSATEYKTHMTLWAMLAAPLLAGNDLTHMSEETRAILLNKAVIAIDQDAAGKQGQRKVKDGDTEVWVKELSNGSKAIAVFNLGAADAEPAVNWIDLGITGKTEARDVWADKTVSIDGSSYRPHVPSHGVVLIIVEAKS